MHGIVLWLSGSAGSTIDRGGCGGISRGVLGEGRRIDGVVGIHHVWNRRKRRSTGGSETRPGLDATMESANGEEIKTHTSGRRRGVRNWFWPRPGCL